MQIKPVDHEMTGRMANKHTILASGQVVPDRPRCVQSGICTHNLPSGLMFAPPSSVASHSTAGRLPVHGDIPNCVCIYWALSDVDSDGSSVPSKKGYLPPDGFKPSEDNTHIGLR